MFKGLNIDGRSAEMGGPNHCFYIEHKDCPTVKRNKDGSLAVEVDQKYNVEGKDRVGMNRQNDIVYFLHRRSPEKGTEILWKLQTDTEPGPAALSKLRSSSDLAFDLWDRVPTPNKQKIERFISVNIVNEDAEEIIKCVLEKINVLEVQGSLNNLGAAYFLLQHHRQLCSIESINKVKLVICEDDTEHLCLRFYVDT
ncbi:hypothetical protein E8E12_011154 [Didymella heteroderae]|uniref:Uncharacterized protein n=1 Tax=Didymella heteroderae TaxID=1769908 RepID=A0A9P4WYL2_9PLEO|nr:hypothetical protein E8E12_011154 [Didymella heteroderae]